MAGKTGFAPVSKKNIYIFYQRNSPKSDQYKLEIIIFNENKKPTRLQFIGHCWRKKDEVISDLLLWEPKHGARKRGRPALTYVDQLQNDTGLSIAELKSIMRNRKEWVKLVNGVRVRSK